MYMHIQMYSSGPLGPLGLGEKAEERLGRSGRPAAGRLGGGALWAARAG